MEWNDLIYNRETFNLFDKDEKIPDEHVNKMSLLEKNYANIICRNSQTRSGAEVSIKWKNKDLLSI